MDNKKLKKILSESCLLDGFQISNVKKTLQYFTTQNLDESHTQTALSLNNPTPGRFNFKVPWCY